MRSPGDCSIIGTERSGRKKAVRILGSSCLLQESCQDGSVLRVEEVATPGKQTTDAHRILGHLVACAGSLAYLFSHRPFRRNEQHEQHAVLFHARHHNPQPLFAEVPSFQEHGAAQSAMLKRGSHLLGFSALASDGVEEKKCFSVLFHLQ